MWFGGCPQWVVVVSSKSVFDGVDAFLSPLFLMESVDVGEGCFDSVSGDSHFVGVSDPMGSVGEGVGFSEENWREGVHECLNQFLS